MLRTCQIMQIDPIDSIVIAQSQREDNISSSSPGLEGREASLVNRKAWKSGSTITIQLMNGTDEQKAFIRSTAEEWLKYANLKFEWVPSGGMIRVGLTSNGSWSLMGTDALGRKSGNTMELGWLNHSVVLHEFGHMLALNHSHNSLNFPYHFNREAVIADLSGPPNNWNISTIEYNVLQRTTEGVTETPWEEKSVMNYECPARWIVEGVGIKPGEEIGTEEANVIKQIYPAGTQTGPNRIMIGQSIQGNRQGEYELVVGSRGIYQGRVTPRSTKIYLNGKILSLKALQPGTYRINVMGTGKFEFMIRRL